MVIFFPSQFIEINSAFEQILQNMKFAVEIFWCFGHVKGFQLYALSSDFLSEGLKIPKRVSNVLTFPDCSGVWEKSLHFLWRNIFLLLKKNKTVGFALCKLKTRIANEALFANTASELE